MTLGTLLSGGKEIHSHGHTEINFYFNFILKNSKILYNPQETKSRSSLPYLELEWKEFDNYYFKLWHSFLLRDLLNSFRISISPCYCLVSMEIEKSSPEKGQWRLRV